MMRTSRALRTAMVGLAACFANRPLQAQSVMLGRTTISLGMNAQAAVQALSQEFDLKPNHGVVQTWYVMSRRAQMGDTTYRVDGQIVAQNGRLTSIMKVISPEQPTSVSVGEAFVAMLERIAGTGTACRVAVERSGIESGPGGGGTILQATIQCGQYRGSLTQVQSSDPSMSKEISIAYMVASPK